MWKELNELTFDGTFEVEPDRFGNFKFDGMFELKAEMVWGASSLMEHSNLG